MPRFVAAVIGVLLVCFGVALLIPKVQRRFVNHFVDARDSWGLPRARAPRFTATAGGVMLIVIGLAMILGGYGSG
jgi:hypothetical protein